MADTNLLIGVEAVGAEEAAAQLNTLAVAETNVTQAVERQSVVTNQATAATNQAAAASQRASAATSRQASAAASLAAAAQNVAGSQERASQASNRFGLSLPRVSEESRKAGLGMAMMFNEGTEMVFMLSSAFPALRQVSILFAGAGNSAFGLARALGPVGVAVAAASAAIPALISLLSDTSDEMDDTAASTDRATRSLQDFIAAQRAAVRAEQQLIRVRAGGGTAEEQAGLAAMVGEQVGEAEARLERVGRAAGVNQQAMARIAEVAREAAAQGRDVSQAVTQQIQFAAATGAITQSEQAQNNIAYAATALANIQRDFDVQQRRAREFREDVRQQQQEEIEFELAAEQDPERFGAGRRRGGGGGRGREDLDRAEQERIAAELERLSAVSQMQNDLQAKREAFRAREAQQLIDAKELQIAIADELIAKLEEREEREKAIAAEAAERYAEQQDQLRELGVAFGDAFEGGVDRTIAAFERLNLALGKAGEDTIDSTELMVQTVKSAYFDMGKTTASGARDAFSAAVEAAVNAEQPFADAIKAQTHEFIRGIVLRSTVAAVEQGALALAAAAMGNPVSAAAHGAAAAQYAAVAGVAASVGAAAGTFTPKRKKAEPVEEPEARRDRDRGQQMMVINVGTFPVSTDADVGRAVQQALQAVERRDGR